MEVAAWRLKYNPCRRVASPPPFSGHPLHDWMTQLFAPALHGPPAQPFFPRTQHPAPSTCVAHTPLRPLGATPPFFGSLHIPHFASPLSRIQRGTVMFFKPPGIQWSRGPLATMQGYKSRSRVPCLVEPWAMARKRRHVPRRNHTATGTHRRAPPLAPSLPPVPSHLPHAGQLWLLPRTCHHLHACQTIYVNY